MFQLIVAVTACAIMFALVLSSIFIGGEAYQKAKERAEARNGKPAGLESATPAAMPSVGSARWVVTDSF